MDMQVALKITAGVSGQQAVDQLRTSMDRMKDTVDGVSSRFGALKGAMAGLAGAAVVAGFVSMMRSMINTADHLNDLSMKTGIAVEDLDALGFAAEQNGSNLDQVSGALGKMAKNMAEAAGGSKEAIAVFKQFGISQAELKSGSLSSTEALARIADKIAAMPDGWQKAAAAQKVFGKSAADMVPLLNAGGDAIRNARAELEGYGALFTGGLAKAADEFNDKMALLKRMGGAVAISLGRELLPVMNAFMAGLIDTRKAQGDLVGDTSLSDWAGVAAQGLAVLVDVARVTAQAIYAVIGSFGAVWADISMAGTFLKDGPTALFTHGGTEALGAALEARNATVADANKRYLTLWNMNGSQTFEAVKAQMDKLKGTLAGGVSDKGGKGGTGGFDFGAGKESEFDRLKQSLQEQLSKVGELTEAEKLLGLLRTDKYKDLTANQRAVLLGLAKELDHTKQMTDVEKALQQRRDQVATELVNKQTQERRSNQDLESDQGIKLKMLALEANAVNMTTREYEARRSELEHQLQVQQATRDMTAGGRAEYERIANAAYKASRGLADMQEAQSKTFEFGAKSAIKSYRAELEDIAGATERAFTNAFKGMEDALVGFVMTGKLDFKSLATSIVSDMARMAIQAMILKPLMGFMGGLFCGGTDVGGYTSSAASFANGGIMTSQGSMPLNAYANGGIANSPQMAIFGEGRMPEAYVPLPDGRSIPVSMKGGAGGGGSVTVNVSVENGGDQVKSSGGAGDLGRAIAGAVKQELINQKRPGGLLAA